MKYTKLPNTNLKVSKICLGTMTFGEQNTEKEAHEQLNYAVSKGVNFIDTAEMYSVPGNVNTQGSSEKILGSWLKNNRDKVIVATKIAGPSNNFKYIRKPLDFSKASLTDAIDKSLNRLQTDFIDLYQLHWPERSVNSFGVRNYVPHETEAWNDNFAEVLMALNDFVKSGKIRYYGVSNETPWGLMRFCEESRNLKVNAPITIQNPYSLLNRTFETGLAEVSHRENVKLLAYSPLAFGVLTGKYLYGENPENARLTLFPQMNRYIKKPIDHIIKSYMDIAEKHGLSLTQMAIAYILHKPFLASVIIGATKMPQLIENIDSIELVLSNEIIKEIELISEQYPNPTP